MGKTNQLGVLADVFTSDASNNVGIGGSPSGSYKLEVTGTAKVSSTLLVSGASTFNSSATVTSASTSGFVVNSTNNASYRGFTIQVNGTTQGGMEILPNTGEIRIGGYSTTSDYFPVIYSDGVAALTFGVGATPSATFSSSISATTGNFSNYIVIGGTSGLNTYGSINQPAGEKIIINAYHGLELKTSGGVGSGTPISVFNVSSGGGLTLNGNATTGLDLSSSTYSYSIDIGNNQFIRQKNNAGTLCLLLGMSSDNTTYLRGSQHIVLQPNNGTSVLTAFNSGNVSIGTNDIGYKLNLNGQPGANGYTLWTNYSDLRLKENITDLEAINVLHKICAIRPVTYNYNELSGFDEATRSRRISGFIAQELMEVFPDMVGTIKKDDIEYYDTNLSNLTLYLVKAVQELNQQNQDLKSRLDKAGL
ncbi:Intramolecular chaperone auto-processing domain containing protein [uncultured Caudovirales phage]|uniref:Intramolecular chaperone auto-processing domain containing protein n=1 Tax=uncultured Caudovirales phage TaxID=2100421 RepID=A0A6J7WDY8_9CAUD|nr:Intramolecular chaperone auto-processing domain containing protein [uncultured Caudovirales phage]